jgi:hypothetical protein
MAAFGGPEQFDAGIDLLQSHSSLLCSDGHRTDGGINFGNFVAARACDRSARTAILDAIFEGQDRLSNMISGGCKPFVENDIAFLGFRFIWCASPNTDGGFPMRERWTGSQGISKKSADVVYDRESDPVHRLVECPPKYSVSVLLYALKRTSSHLLRNEQPDIAARY